MDRRKGEVDCCWEWVGEFKEEGESKENEWKCLTMSPFPAVASHQLPLSHILHLISPLMVPPPTSLLPQDFSFQLKTF